MLSVLNLHFKNLNSLFRLDAADHAISRLGAGPYYLSFSRTLKFPPALGKVTLYFH